MNDRRCNQKLHGPAVRAAFKIENLCSMHPLNLIFFTGSDISLALNPAKGADMANPKQIVQPSDLPVRKSHSQVVAVTGGTLVFIAGMTSRSEKDATPIHPGDMRAQLRQVCENIGRALRSVGGDYSDVVKTTTFTTDVEEYHRVSDERYKYFKSDLPTSALIGVVRLADPALMVEIECMAVIPTERFKPAG
jgi:2-iminobutanoate/2-iminopropanoate deaminase